MGARVKPEGARWWDKTDNRIAYSRVAMRRRRAHEAALELVDEAYRPAYFENLSEKEWLFAKLVVEKGSVVEAGKAAGLGRSRTSYMKPLVKEAVAWWMARKGVSVEEVRSRLSDIARGDIGEFLDEDGNVDIERARRKGLTHLIKRYRVRERPNGSRLIELELYDALVSLQTLAKIYGMVVEDKIENNTTVVVYIPDNHRRVGVDVGEVIDSEYSVEEGKELGDGGDEVDGGEGCGNE